MPVELPELVITSKTQSPAKIREILEGQGYKDFEMRDMTEEIGNPPAPPAEPTPPAEVPPVETPPAGDHPVAGEEDEEEEEVVEATPPAPPADGSAVPPKKKPGSAKLKEKVAALTTELETLKQTLAAKPPAAEPTPTPVAKPAEEPEPTLRAKPKWEDFSEAEDQVAAFTEAMAEFKVDERDFKQEKARREKEKAEAPARQAMADAEAENRRVQTTFLERSTAVKAEHPDFDQKLNAIPPTPVMASVVLREEDGPQLAYWLANNPDELTALNAATKTEAGDSPAKVQAAIGKVHQALGRIRYIMSQEQAPPPESRETPPAAPPATPKPPAAAAPAPPAPPAKPKPTPVTPVGSRAATHVKTLAQMSAEEVRALHPDDYRRLKESQAQA